MLYYNFDIEYTEHQHILDVKQLYRAINKYDPIPQVLCYVHHPTALEMKAQYLQIISSSLHIPPAHHQYSLRSRLPNCPMTISTANQYYKLNDLEINL